MIIKECIEIIVNKYATLLQEVVIKNLVIGRHFTAVELSDGSCGLANSGTPVRTVKQHSGKRFSGDFAPGNYCGREVLDLLQFKDDDRIPLSVTLAVMNAISSGLPLSKSVNILRNTDPVDVLNINQQSNVTVVGAFDSYIRKVMPVARTLHVVELHKEALAPEYQNLFVPYEHASEVLSDSDIVLITGSTLVNETFTTLMAMIGSETFVAVTGPSSNLLPEVLFGKGVSCIGATRITNAEMMFRIIAEGGSGYHLFGRCAEKICLLKS
jgi:uncharacterized protein